MSQQDPQPPQGDQIVDAPTAAVTGFPADAIPDPDKTPKTKLAADADDLGIDPAGKTKDQLAAAIGDVRATGRPPLAQVGEEALAEEAARTTTVVIDPDSPDQIQEA